MTIFKSATCQHCGHRNETIIGVWGEQCESCGWSLFNSHGELNMWK